MREWLVDYSPLLGDVLVVIVAALGTPGFLSAGNIVNLLFQIPMLVIVTLGLVMVLLGGGLDVSTGAIVSLSGVLSARLLAEGLGVGPAFAVGLSTGALLGMFNGMLVAWFEVDSLIATFGTNVAVQGIIYALCEGVTIPLPATGRVSAFRYLGQGAILGHIPLPGFLSLVVCVLLVVFLSQTRPGWHVRAVGENRWAARLFGVHDRWTILGAFTWCGFCAGLAGLVLAARTGGGSPIGGEPYTLNAIAAAYLGAAFFGKGVPNPVGGLLGAVTFVVIDNALSLVGAEFALQSMARGAIVVIALLFGSLMHWLSMQQRTRLLRETKLRR